MADTETKNIYKLRTKVMASMRTNVTFKEYVAYLKHCLDNEREEYESNIATEFARGRVSMLKTMIGELEGK